MRKAGAAHKHRNAIGRHLFEGVERRARLGSQFDAAVDSRLWPAAALSVQAHLIKLVAEGRVTADPAPTLEARYALG